MLQAVLILLFFCHISNVCIVLIKLNKGSNPIQLMADSLSQHNLEAPVGHHSSQDWKTHGAIHKSTEVNQYNQTCKKKLLFEDKKVAQDRSIARTLRTCIKT